MTEWWRDFFDSDYVDAWTAAGVFDRTAEEVEGIIDLLDLVPGARILDVPCGFGRIAGPLHDRGFAVTGVDLSSEQLALAEQRHPGPDYICGDMRDPPGGGYDAVLNIFTSFGYFAEMADDRAALAAWHDVLRPGGTLVMTTNHRDRLAYQLGGQAVAPPAEDVDEQGEEVLREELTTDWVRGVRTSTVTFRGTAKTFRVRMYTVTELVGMLGEAGFSEVAAFGDFAGAPATPDRPLIVRAVR